MGAHDRIGRAGTARAGALVATAGIVIVVAVPVPVAPYVGAVLWGLGICTVFPAALSATLSQDPRVVWAEIDREARKGKPIPSDHAPLVIDIDAPGCPFDAGWVSADERIAGRRSRLR